MGRGRKDGDGASSDEPAINDELVSYLKIESEYSNTVYGLKVSVNINNNIREGINDL